MERLDTLAALKADNYTIRAYCETQGCGHGAFLDLDALMDRLGPDFVAIGDPQPLAAKLRCAKCGGRHLSLRLSPGVSDGHGVIGHREKR